MIIGGEDEKLIEGEQVAKLKMKHDSHYLVQLDGMSIGGASISGEQTALLDTGNTLICLPLKFKDAFSNALRTKGLRCDLYKEHNPDFFQVGCRFKKDLSDVPTLEVKLGGFEFKVQKEYMVDRCRKVTELEEKGQVLCLINVEMQKDGEYFILGNVFLMTFYIKLKIKKLN